MKPKYTADECQTFRAELVTLNAEAREFFIWLLDQYEAKRRGGSRKGSGVKPKINTPQAARRREYMRQWRAKR